MKDDQKDQNVGSAGKEHRDFPSSESLKTDSLKAAPITGDEEEEFDTSYIPCSRCGRETTFDPTYGDLCFRCCRAENE